MLNILVIACVGAVVSSVTKADAIQTALNNFNTVHSLVIQQPVYAQQFSDIKALEPTLNSIASASLLTLSPELLSADQLKAYQATLEDLAQKAYLVDQLTQTKDYTVKTLQNSYCFEKYNQTKFNIINGFQLMLAYNKDQTNEDLKKQFQDYCIEGNVCIAQVQVLDNIMKGKTQDECQLVEDLYHGDALILLYQGDQVKSMAEYHDLMTIMLIGTILESTYSSMIQSNPNAWLAIQTKYQGILLNSQQTILINDKLCKQNVIPNIKFNIGQIAQVNSPNIKDSQLFNLIDNYFSSALKDSWRIQYFILQSSDQKQKYAYACGSCIYLQDFFFSNVTQMYYTMIASVDDKITTTSASKTLKRQEFADLKDKAFEYPKFQSMASDYFQRFCLQGILIVPLPQMAWQVCASISEFCVPQKGQNIVIPWANSATYNDACVPQVA